MRRARVYVAGPVGALEVRRGNVSRALRAADRLAMLGYAPYIPHLHYFWDMEIQDHDYEFWMTLCMEWLGTCDAILRIPGASPGADREVARAEELGIPVYRSVDDVASSLPVNLPAEGSGPSSREGERV